MSFRELLYRNPSQVTNWPRKSPVRFIKFKISRTVEAFQGIELK